MKVCFWGDNSGALTGNPSGGGELQIALLANALIKSGHEVVFVDYSVTEDFITDSGIKVFCIKGYNNGIRMLRTITRLRLIYMSLKKQEAEVYYCRIRDFRHILAFLASHKVKAKFILALASDLDVTGIWKRMKYFYFAEVRGLWWFFNGIMSEIIYSWLLRHSDLVLVQHEGQKSVLLKKHIQSKILYNLIDLNEIPLVKNPTHLEFCYVGSLDRRKGFADFYNIVKESEKHSFKVIGTPRDETGEICYEKLKMFKNVTLLGRLSHSDTLYHISNSKALISTSPMEGFPNIFIEAWACGIPVLSLFFDPGNIIQKEELGFVAKGDIKLFLNAMATVNPTPEFSVRARGYVGENHILSDSKLKEINKMLYELTENRELVASDTVNTKLYE